jgi:hypothetical protein
MIMAGGGGIMGVTPPDWGANLATEAAAVASAMLGMAEQYANQLTQEAAQLQAPAIAVNYPTPPAAPKVVDIARPALVDVSWQTPTQPAAFTGTLNVGALIPGPFEGLPPTLNFGSQPAAFAAQEPPSPTLDLNFVYPEVSVTLPTVPALMSLDVVQFTPLVIPTFDTIEPVLTINPPTVLPYVENAFYTSQTLSDVQSEIQSALTSDTDIGLTASTQQAMWDAAREREYRQQADALAALDRDYEVLGYAFPPGVYLDARVKIQTETDYSIQGLSRDIMIKQAELRLENVTKARELAVSLEGQLITYYNAICQRSFEAARYLTEAGVQIYNAEVQAFAARIQGFQASVQAYEASMRGIETYVEQLKAQIQFEQTKAEINTALVQQYRTMMDGALAQLQVYKTQVDIIQTEAQVEKLKVDTFSAQIQAYVGQVNAYAAQIEAYKANIQAQTAIEETYKVQVDAYSAEVQAGVAAAQALIAQYDGQVKAYEAQLSGYRASLEAMVAQAHAAQEWNVSSVEAYKGAIQGIASYNQTVTSQWEAIVNEQVQIAGVAIKAAEANGQLYISSRQLILDASKTAAQVAAQLGAAALNAVHASATANWSVSGTASSSIAASTSVATTTSTSTNTNYNESA